MVWGSTEANPTIMSEKNKPMDNTIPLFMKVARMPDADPRWSTGAEPMMLAVLGAVNRPNPTPLISSNSAKVGYEKSAGSSIRSANVTAPSSMPPVAKGLAPKRSDNQPDI